MEHQLPVHIEQMVLVFKPADINIILEQQMVEIHHLQDELLWVVDMVQVHTGDTHPIMVTQEQVEAAEVHLVIVTVPVMVEQPVLVDVVHLQLSQCQLMVVMETVEAVELVNIIQAVEVVRVELVEKERQVVHPLEEMVLRIQF
jgi:hypothetical protein